MQSTTNDKSRSYSNCMYRTSVFSCFFYTRLHTQNLIVCEWNAQCPHYYFGVGRTAQTACGWTNAQIQHIFILYIVIQEFVFEHALECDEAFSFLTSSTHFQQNQPKNKIGKSVEEKSNVDHMPTSSGLSDMATIDSRQPRKRFKLCETV